VVAVVAYLLGLRADLFGTEWRVSLANAGVRIATWDGNTRELRGLELMPGQEAGFATMLLAAVTVWLAWETRVVATASRKQLQRLDDQQRSSDLPILDWTTTKGAPWFQPERADNNVVWILVPCEATNVGGIAAMGETSVEEGVALIHDQTLKTRILRNQRYTVLLSFGPFHRGAAFEASCVLRQTYRPFGRDGWQQDSVLIWVAHDWKSNEPGLRVVQVFPEERDYAAHKRALLARFGAMARARRFGLTDGVVGDPTNTE
jgi:hypothetical protein